MTYLHAHAELAPITGKTDRVLQVSAMGGPSCGDWPTKPGSYIALPAYNGNPHDLKEKSFQVHFLTPTGIPAPFIAFEWAYTGWKFWGTTQWCKTGRANTGISGTATITVPMDYGLTGGWNGLFFVKAHLPLGVAQLGATEASPIVIA